MRPRLLSTQYRQGDTVGLVSDGGGGGAAPVGLMGSFAPQASTSAYLAALHAAMGGGGQFSGVPWRESMAAATGGPVMGGGPSSDPTSTLQSIVQALAGPPPQQVQPVPMGPAPTLADYFSAAPYQQATRAVESFYNPATGRGSSADAVNRAYGQALQQAIAMGKQASGQAAGYVNQAKTDAANAAAAEHANIATAMQGAAPGSLLANQLQGTQATLNANNQRGAQDAQFLANLVNANNSGYQQALQGGKANALQFLASQTQNELGKIGLQQASDQTRAQEMLRQALNAYQTNNQNNINSAAATNSKNYQAYQTQAQNALKQIMTMSSSLASTPHDQLVQTLNGPNMLDHGVVNLFDAVVNGVPSTGPNGQPINGPHGKAVNLVEAMQRLQSSGVDQGTQSAVADMLKSWFNNTKQAAGASQVEQYLHSILGGA